MSRLLSSLKNLESRASNWSSILGFISMAFAVFAPLTWTIKEVIFASGLVLLSAGAIGTSLIGTLRSGRKALHAEAIGSIREAVRKITTECLDEYRSGEERTRRLSCAMDDLSKAFSIVSGSDCRCCVKIITQPQPGNLHVVTLCRNSGYRGLDASHSIEDNTDFNELFHDKYKTWFFGSNLPELWKAGRYANTARDWQTRYSSTIVWPIRCEPKDRERPELLGFLCVDSKRDNPFSEKYDYALGAIVADVLGPFLLRLPESMKDTASDEVGISTNEGPAGTNTPLPDATETTPELPANTESKTAGRAKGRK